ncbi:MAG: HesA/MoeB/ThiF family protein [Opitutales bacterium]
MDRYARQCALEGFGEEGQNALSKSSIALIGTGGVGSACVALLAGAGVGRIVLIDGDVVSISNLHRQSIYKTSQVGQSKAELAKKYAQELNPNIKVECFSEFLSSKEDFAKAIENVDLCIDATDSFASRFAISEYLKEANIPYIMASAEKYLAQMVLFGDGFYLNDFMPNGDFANEKPAKSAIFAPTAQLSGVWASGEAISILAKAKSFEAGKFQYFDMQRGKFFSTKF